MRIISRAYGTPPKRGDRMHSPDVGSVLIDGCNNPKGPAMAIRSIAPMLLAFAPVLSNAAAGWDGIYSCSVSAPGLTTQVYVTINAQPDGRAVFAVAAVTPSTPFYGYGIGQISGTTFTGSTMFNRPFAFTSSDRFGVTGNVGIVLSGRTYTAQASCLKVW